MLGIKKAGYETATPIQEAAIPAALRGRDLIGTAQTGTLDARVGFQKLAYLRGRQCFGLLHCDLHSSAARLSRIPHFQDHLVLETSSVSGSSCIG